jgi:CBS domain-containing protein
MSTAGGTIAPAPHHPPKVRDWMSRDVVVVGPRTSLLNARRLLERHGVRHLPVVDGDQVVGMVSDRDLQVRDRVLALTLSTLQSDLVSGRYRMVASVMSAPVLLALADEPVSRAAQLMAERRVGALPVLDHGRLVGILTTTDCLRGLVALDAAAHAEAATAQAAARRAARPLLATPGGAPDDPGRRPVALVVDPDDAQRGEVRRQLAERGYEVHSCGGPLAGVRCPGLSGSVGKPCPRVPVETTLVVLEGRTATRTCLPDAYAAWAPKATITWSGSPEREP